MEKQTYQAKQNKIFKIHVNFDGHILLFLTYEYQKDDLDIEFIDKHNEYKQFKREDVKTIEEVFDKSKLNHNERYPK